MQRKQEKIISNNKSVYHNYFVEDVIEAAMNAAKHRSDELGS